VTYCGPERRKLQNLRNAIDEAPRAQRIVMARMARMLGQDRLHELDTELAQKHPPAYLWKPGSFEKELERLGGKFKQYLQFRSEGLDNKEIAKKIGCSSGSIKSLEGRTRRSLNYYLPFCEPITREFFDKHEWMFKWLGHHEFPPRIDYFAAGNIMDMPIGVLEISVRSWNCMYVNKIMTVGELVSMSEARLLKIRNFSHGSLEDVRKALATHGLRLGMGEYQ